MSNVGSALFENAPFGHCERLKGARQSQISTGLLRFQLAMTAARHGFRTALKNVDISFFMYYNDVENLSSGKRSVKMANTATFQKKSPGQEDSCLFCLNDATLEATCGTSKIRCCTNEACKEAAAGLAERFVKL